MIYVRRSRVPIPADLDGDESLAARELRSNLPHAKQGRKEKLSFNVYREQAVLAALVALFRRKCAYCEGDDGAGDIEHFRPKGRIWVWEISRGNATGKRKYLTGLGYWWLAADWNNLLLACGHCNSQRRHEMIDGSYQVLGKSDYFPVEDERKRARSPASLRNEKPLLLNPCRDDPSKHLAFSDDGAIHPIHSGKRARRAKVTIDGYGLNRLALLQARANAKVFWDVSLLNLTDFVVYGEGRASTAEATYVELLSAMSESKRFSAFARHVISPGLAALQPRLDQLFPNARMSTLA